MGCHDTRIHLLYASYCRGLQPSLWVRLSNNSTSVVTSRALYSPLSRTTILMFSMPEVSWLIYRMSWLSNLWGSIVRRRSIRSCLALENICSQILEVGSRERASSYSVIALVTDAFSRFMDRSTMLSDAGSASVTALCSYSRPRTARFSDVVRFCFLAFWNFTTADSKIVLCRNRAGWFHHPSTVRNTSSTESKYARAWQIKHKCKRSFSIASWSFSCLVRSSSILCSKDAGDNTSSSSTSSSLQTKWRSATWRFHIAKWKVRHVSLDNFAWSDSSS